MKEDLIFNVTDWQEYHTLPEEIPCEDPDEEPLERKGQYMVQMYGRTKEGKTVYVQVNGFTPYFFVEIPGKWKKRQVQKFVDCVKYRIYPKEFQENLISWDIVKKHKFYGFTAGKLFKFVRFIFDNAEACKKFSNFFKKPIKIPGLTTREKKYQVYESNISPMLRLMHIRNLQACGWVRIKKSRYDELPKSVTNTDIKIETHWQNLQLVDEKNIAKLIIASFDIECDSVDGRFPQAKRKGDKIIQIGTTFSYYGETECFYKHIITLGTCADIPGVDVESYPKEKDVLLGWRKLILRMDPDIITGWNIFGFDEKYIYDRAKRLGILKEFCELGREKNVVKENEPPFWYSPEEKEYFRNKFRMQTLQSSALGTNNMYYFTKLGRVTVDMLKVTQRDHALKSYKLDNVATHFITFPIKKASGNVIETKSEGNLKHFEEQMYIKIFEDSLAYQGGEKFKIEKIDGTKIYLNKPVNLTLSNYKYHAGLAKDDVPPDQIFALQKGSAEDRATVAKYCIQDCALCNKLMGMLDVVTNNIGMGNVCNVPLSYLFFRGQGVKIFSLVSKECRELNYLIPVVKKPDGDSEGYDGAIVFQPTIGFYEDPIVVLDYASLYPRSMIHKNLSHETLVTDDDYMNLEGYTYTSIDYEEKDGTEVTWTYAKKDGEFGILPNILQTLLDERDATKKLMKKETDPFKKSILNGHQLALKITANSLYGQTGAPTSPIFLRPIAASTTTTGREMLELAQDYMDNDFPKILKAIYKNLNKPDVLEKIYKREIKNYEKEKSHKLVKEIEDLVKELLDNYNFKPKTVYGDTDSVFVNMRIKNKDGTPLRGIESLRLSIALGVAGGELIKVRLAYPHDLEYEKTFWPFGIMSKKRYVGKKFEFKTDDYKMTYMGIELKRRDNADIVKKVYNGFLKLVMDLDTFDKDAAVNYVKKFCIDILNGKFKMGDFVITKTLKGDYKFPERNAHVVLAERMGERDPGNKPQANDRIPYVFIQTEKDPGRNWKNIKTGENVEHPIYVKKNKLKIDYLYYIEKQIRKPLQRFLALLVDDPDAIFDDLKLRESNRRKGVQPLSRFGFKRIVQDTVQETVTVEEEEYSERTEEYSEDTEYEEDEYSYYSDNEPPKKTKPKVRVKKKNKFDFTL